jgi:omega-6 fatty acid desaturase (delta-12 desaturase)
MELAGGGLDIRHETAHDRCRSRLWIGAAGAGLSRLKRLTPTNSSTPQLSSASAGDPDPTEVNAQGIKRQDFVLKPFMVSSNWLATRQLVNTLVPYVLLWAVAVVFYHQGSWLLLPVLIAMVLFLSRCFSLMHDCGHESLFQHRPTNRRVGFVLGVIAAIPQLPWSRGHAYHHRHNGNWQLYQGPAAVISTHRFDRLAPGKQRLYRWMRHPMMLIPGGFFYLVIKPRIELLAGLAALVPDVIRRLQDPSGFSWKAAIQTHQSSWWHSPEEFNDLLFNNLAVVLSWVALCWLLGAKLFWLIYAPVMAGAAAIFICVFFIQHNFPGSYAHSSENWNAMDGTLLGTSDLELPALLRWFSADIGCHAIHHLCSAIPNYRLRAAQQANVERLQSVKQLTLWEIPSCFDYILWDEASGSLTTVAAHQTSAGRPVHSN